MSSRPRTQPVSCTIAALADVFACSTRAESLAREMGFGSRAVWEISIVVSELGTNILRHADGGTIVLREVWDPEAGLEIVAEDAGPGIDDVAAAMTDDFSQGRCLSETTPPPHREGLGSGLGAIQRLSDALDVSSSPEHGTRVAALKRLTSPTAPRRATGPSLLLGLGNAILSDDGVGIKVARYVAKSGMASDFVVKEAEVAGFALLDLLEGFHRVVIVDAVRTADTRPGDVVVIDGASLAPSLHLVAGHQIDLPAALALGRSLGRPLPRHIHIVGVGIEDDRTFSEQCTPAVAQAVPKAAHIAVRLLGLRLSA